MPPSKKRRGPDGDTVRDDWDWDDSIDEIEDLTRTKQGKDDVQAFKKLALDSDYKELSNQAEDKKNHGQVSQIHSAKRGMALVDKFRTARRKAADNMIANLNETEPAHLKLKARLSTIVAKSDICDGEDVDPRKLNLSQLKTIFNKDYEKGALTPLLLRSKLFLEDWSVITSMLKPAVLSVLRFASSDCDSCPERLKKFIQSDFMKILVNHMHDPEKDATIMFSLEHSSLASLQVILGCYCNVPGVLEVIRRKQQLGMKFYVVDEGLDCWTQQKPSSPQVPSFPPTPSHQMPPEQQPYQALQQQLMALSYPPHKSWAPYPITSQARAPSPPLSFSHGTQPLPSPQQQSPSQFGVHAQGPGVPSPVPSPVKSTAARTPNVFSPVCSPASNGSGAAYTFHANMRGGSAAAGHTSSAYSHSSGSAKKRRMAGSGGSHSGRPPRGPRSDKKGLPHSNVSPLVQNNLAGHLNNEADVKAKVKKEEDSGMDTSTS